MSVAENQGMRLTASVVTLFLMTSACYSTTRYRIPGDGDLSREYAKACQLDCSSRLGDSTEYYECLATCPGVERAPGESCGLSARSTSIMCEEQREVRRGPMAFLTGGILLGVLATAVAVGLSGEGGSDISAR